MTTIAYDGRYVAADSRTMAGDVLLSGRTEKLRVHGGYLFALCGAGAAFGPWVDWFMEKQACKNPTLPNLDKDRHGSTNFMVFKYDLGWQMFSLGVPYSEWRNEPHAWGSGDMYAITAMDCGKLAHEAVILAAKRDPYTDDRVMVYDLLERCFVEPG